MDASKAAAALGRLGGQSRARRLSPAAKARIAALGGEARARSLLAARRIEQNFRYVAMIDELREVRPARVRRQRTCSEPLPGLHSKKP
jgi:hypothetical protein